MLVAIVFAITRWKTWRRARTEIASIGCLGAVGCAFLAAQAIAIYCALLLTRVSNVALLINTSPCFCALGDIYWLKEALPGSAVAEHAVIVN